MMWVRRGRGDKGEDSTCVQSGEECCQQFHALHEERVKSKSGGTA